MCIHVLLQAVEGLHAEGWAHCDLKGQNVRVLLDHDGKVVSLTVHDMGGSIKYQGGSKTVVFLHRL